MYTLESRVRYSECDKTGKLSLVGAMNYLQDCSSFHSEHIGRGFEALAQEHLAWVLASWQIEVVRMPHFNEKITVGTWAYVQLQSARKQVPMQDALEQAPQNHGRYARNEMTSSPGGSSWLLREITFRSYRIRYNEHGFQAYT